MEPTVAFFYIFSLVMLFSAFRVVTARNPVHAVLFLMLTFSQAAGLWLLLRAEFLAITLVLVYLGAVMVLFLFVVMMLDIRIDGVRQNFWRHVPVALMVGALVALEMGLVLFGGFGHEPAPVLTAEQLSPDYSNAKALGLLLYTKYLYPIEIAAVLLLIAMITAIALTLRARKDTKTISPSQQVHVRAEDRLRVVKVDAVAPASSSIKPVEGEK